MVEQTKPVTKTELIIDCTEDNVNVHFRHDGQKFVGIHLSGEENFYFIGEWEESSWAFIHLEVVAPAGDVNLPSVEFRTNLAEAKDRKILENVAQKANVAIRSGQSIVWDITDELNSKGMDVYFSNEPTPRRR